MIIFVYRHSFDYSVFLSFFAGVGKLTSNHVNHTTELPLPAQLAFDGSRYCVTEDFLTCQTCCQMLFTTN